MSTLITTKPTAGRGGTGIGTGSGNGWGGDGHGGGESHGPSSIATWRLGMFFALASVTMLFLGLTSAYVFRQGSGLGWRPIEMPPLLLINTLVIVVSSASMERARRVVRFAGHAASTQALQLWLGITLLLGLVFVGGQVAVWQQLSDKGIYLSSNPHSSFFYLLTGLHGLHLLGGVAALLYLFSRTRWSYSVPPARSVEVAAIYWHFMGVLWLYLLMLLFTWS